MYEHESQVNIGYRIQNTYNIYRCQMQSIDSITIRRVMSQGDMERLQLNITPMGMMDRDRKDELPEMQVGLVFGL